MSVVNDLQWLSVSVVSVFLHLHWRDAMISVLTVSPLWPLVVWSRVSGAIAVPLVIVTSLAVLVLGCQRRLRRRGDPDGSGHASRMRAMRPPL